jgi:hypothetical protein
MSITDFAQSLGGLADAGHRRIANLQAQLVAADTPELRDLLNRTILVTTHCVAQSMATVKDAGDSSLAEIQGRAVQLRQQIDALRDTASTAADSEKSGIDAEIARKTREMTELLDRAKTRAKRGAEYDEIARSLAAQAAILAEIIWVRSSSDQFSADLSPILVKGLIKFPGLSQMMKALELYKKGRTLGIDETIGADDYADAVERYWQACASWFGAFSSEYQPRINAFRTDETA